MHLGSDSAYPSDDSRSRPDECGLRKRELFAAMAMQGFCAIPKINCQISPEIVARDAVRLADALLTELAKGLEQ